MTVEEVLKKMRSASTLEEWEEALKMRMSYHPKNDEEAQILMDAGESFYMSREGIVKIEAQGQIARAS